MVGDMVFIMTSKRPDILLRQMARVGPHEFVIAIIEITFVPCPPPLEEKRGASL